MIAQKVGLVSSAVAFVGGTVAAVDPAGPESSPALQVASGALVAAVIAGVGPWVIALIAKWGDKRIIELEFQVEALRATAAQVDMARAEVEEAKREVVRYQERLRHLEERVDRNTGVIKAVKNVVRSDVMGGTASQLSAVAAIVTDAHGKILTASGQVEFILQWKPEEMIGQNISEYIKKPLHPDLVNHAARSFNPNVEFKDRTIFEVIAFANSGKQVSLDVMVTRWFEPGQKGSITGVRFGKLLRKHNPVATGLVDPFPPIDDFIPGIPREEIEVVESGSA